MDLPPGIEPLTATPPTQPDAIDWDPAAREGLRDHVEAALADHLSNLEAELAAISPDAAVLAHSGRRLVDGGKRLRAAFCYWGWRGATNAEPPTELYEICAALELFQTAALAHDDIMDGSDTRRGAPSVHREFEGRHAKAGWSGNGSRFGESAGLLIGDLFLIESDRVFARGIEAFAPPVRREARRVFDQMRTEVTVGQYLDVLAEVTAWGVDPAADLKRARTIIRAKSARYSIEHPLVLGAAIGGVREAELDLWSDVGLPVGEAFQLRDDILGIFGDPERTGKPAGDDLREGKRTVLATFGFERASQSDRKRLLQALGDPSLTDLEVEELAQILVNTGAVDRVEELISKLLSEAQLALTRLDLKATAREALEHLIAAATHRIA